MDLENICKKTRELAVTVGDFVRKQQTSISSERIENKGKHDFVTFVDKASEKNWLKD